MLLILLSWIYILFSTINLGYFFEKIFKLTYKNFIITSIFGLFFVTILASIWAIFGRINIEFHITLLVFNLISFRFNKLEIIKYYKKFWLEIKTTSKTLNFFLLTISLMIIAQCSSIPYVIDNESYYIQTIKWINEYGFVKGIVNLHFFLGQTSGWHVTQSAFNFSFLYQNFNDLSGFILVLGVVFCIQKLHFFFQNNNSNYLLLGLFPITSVFLFQFISAPSPDIPVFILTFIVFFYFLESYNKCSIESLNIIIILLLFILYIKNSSITLLLLPVFLVIKNFKSLSKHLSKPFFLSLLILLLYLVKNMIICGTPVFPAKLFPYFITDYALPKNIEDFNYSQFQNYGYLTDSQQYNSMSALDLFKRWLSLPKLNGLFNKVSILLILTTPLFIYKFQNKKSFWILYLLMVVQLVILFATSPQYRFFMNYILFFSIFCFICLFSNRKIINSVLLLSLIPTFIILFIPIHLSRLSNNKFMNEVSNFSVNNFIYPSQNSKINTSFERIQLGNLIYNSPVQNDFFWASGNGALPCVNKEQINYFYKYFHSKPQLRTRNLKDGFYSIKTNTND